VDWEDGIKRGKGRRKNLGVNYGWIFTAWGIAGIFGPMIGDRGA